MRKVLFGLMLIMGSGAADASGLYLSGGYGMGDPEFGYSATTCESTSLDPITGCYPDFAGVVDTAGNILQPGIPGWPGSVTSANGFWAKDFAAGLPERTQYNTQDASVYSFAIGWDLKRNPFRVEGEYKKISFNSPTSNLYIDDPNGGWCPDGSYNAATATCSVAWIPDTEYEFGLTYDNPIETDVTAYMANVYFELPYFKSFDPYIGYGFGMATVDVNGVNSIGQSFTGGSKDNVDASQIIAGIEYRFDESPIILGLEYRQFKVDYNERDDNLPNELKHEYFLFKMRYDFISNRY